MSELSLQSSVALKKRHYNLSRIRKSRNSFKSLIIGVIFFLIMQAAISWYVGLNTVYHYRLNYNMFLKDQKTIEIVIEEIGKTIKKKKLTNYVILIGDSVAWGTNETSEHSLGRYLNDQAVESRNKEKIQAVFNLSAPSIQLGDAYTLLLMLEKEGIKTDNVIIGLTYSAFNERNPGPKAVFWLADYLREVDKEAFHTVLPQLQKNKYTYRTEWKYAEEKTLEKIYREIPIIKYKDVIIFYWKQQWRGTDLLGDPRPWNEKEYTAERLNDPQYLNFFNPKPFKMTEDNWGIYFMNRILDHQQGKRTVVFVSGGNGELSSKEVNNDGYRANLNRIDEYLSGKNIDYLLLQDKIDPSLFTDHVHLTKDGNQELACYLWDLWLGNGE